MIEPLDVLRAVAAHGLPGVLPPSADARIVGADAVAIAANLRIEGLLWSALSSGDLDADDDVREMARTCFVQAALRSLHVERRAALAVTALEDAGVPVLVLKGLAIANLDHADPSERSFADADLLVRRADHGRAVRAVVDAGMRRLEPPVRMWWERRYGKAFVVATDDGGEIDVHLAITGGYFGVRIDHDRLWEHPSEPFDLAGRTVRGLDVEGRWLQACCHAVLGGGSGLRALRDVAQLLLVSGVDWRAVVERCVADGADAVPAAAVTATWSELRLDPDHPAAVWAAAHRADPPQSSALAGYRTDAGWRSEGRHMVRALAPIDRVLFLAGLAAPSRASRRHRRRSVVTHVRRGAAAMRSVSGQ